MSFYNYLSLFLGGLEVFLFPMITRGFPIVQFIFEEQKLFMNEKCSVEDIKNDVYCEEARAVFGDIYSAMLLAINGGSFFFGVLYLKIGGANLRLILGLLMTTGLFLISFSKTSPYFFYAGMVLSSTGIIMWIPLNTMIGPVFQHNASYVVMFLSALVVGSGATFWYGKLAYYAGFDFDSFVFIIAIASIMTIVRTLLLFPSVTIPKDVPDDFCVFQTSILGRVLCRNQVSPDDEEPQLLETKPLTFKQYLPYLFHPVNIALMVWDNFGFFRSYTFIGWMVPWLNHGFNSHVDACFGNVTCIEGIQDLKSATMDSLGILQVASPLLPILLMAYLKWNVSRYPKSYPLPQLRENINTLNSRGIVITLLAVSMTIIMWFPIPVASSGYSTFALILWILHLTYLNSWYIMFLYQFAPPQMIPLLFAAKFIGFPIYYINTPLYSSILAEIDADIDFTISSAILLTMVLATSTVLIYFYFWTQRFMRAKERTFLYFPNPSGWKGERRSIFKKIADIFVNKE